MGKSKTAGMRRLDDGGLVLRQSSLIIETHEKAQMRRAREVEFARRQQEEYDKPIPDFPPRVPQEVRGQFFQYVARVVSDTLWSLENQEYRDDPFGYEQENAAIFGEEIPSHQTKPPRKKVPAECLKAALRISQLKNGWQEKDYELMNMERGEARWKKLDELKKKIGLRVSMHVVIDIGHACFDKTDRFWLNDGDYRGDFRKRIEYRIKRNLWKNVPYFTSFDPGNQNGDSVMRVVKWDVWRQDDDFELLKKSGYLGSDEEKVIHLEIF